jgi:hypothetical protein
MLAAILYSVFVILVFVRVWFVNAPVILTPLTILVLHTGYFLFLLCVVQSISAQIIVVGLLLMGVLLLVVILRRTIIIPFNQTYINEQIVESCRMLRIEVELMEGGVYELRTKAGQTKLFIGSIAHGVLIGTMRTKPSRGNDAKIVLLNRLLKKKFASLVPHIIIKTN